MSGIFGALAEIEGDGAEKMSGRLAHRGTNSVVAELSNGGFIGATADDPADCIYVRDDQAIAIAGDIFNLDHISNSILGGRVTRGGTSNAEAILDLYNQFGPQGLEMVDGNFALVIVDIRAGEVVFGRDFFGIMPLYYAATENGTTIFASEYKALLGLKEFIPVVDLDMLQYLQHSKKLPIGRTLFRNIVSPPPGTVQRAKNCGNAIEEHAFKPLSVKVQKRTEGATIELLRTELIKAVRRNTNGSGNIGLALSGGIDSIGLAFMLRKLYPEREIHTFSAGSDEDDHELRTAATVASIIGSIHHEVLTPPNLVRDVLRDVIWHVEDPYARSEVPQLYEIGRAARGHVKTILSGQGADSLFAGMPRYRLLWLIKKLPLFRRSLEEFYNRTQYGISPKSPLGRLLVSMYYRGQTSGVPTIIGASYAAKPQPFPRVEHDFVNIMMAKGFQSGQCQDALKYERSFAAFGIKYRLPFSDLEFTRFAYTIDDSLKIRFGKNKYILRKALAGFVPEEFLNIPKFAQRVRCDLEFSEVLDNLKDTLLSEDGVKKRALFDYEELLSLFQRSENRPYTDEISMRLWTVIATELWADIFADGYSSERALGRRRYEY